VKVWGVEPEAGNDVQQSLARGEIVHIDTPRTIADGAQTQQCGALTFPVIRQLVSGVLTVSDAQLVATMRFFAERMKMVVEPTGCLAAAALLEGAIDLRGQRVGVILSRRQRRPGRLPACCKADPPTNRSPMADDTSKPAASGSEGHRERSCNRPSTSCWRARRRLSQARSRSPGRPPRCSTRHVPSSCP
jgi:threonine dehydratase